MTSILVVGGAGYIGGYLVDILSALPNTYVAVYDNLLYEVQYLKKVPFIFGDVRNHEKLKTILPHYDVVIWLTAIVGDQACQVDAQLTREINVDSVKWLVDNYTGKIVYASTCSVYGRNDDLLDEDSPVSPLSDYARTKLEAEQYIVAHAKNYLIFRLGTLFGQGDEYSRIRFDLVVNVLSMRAARGEPLSVYGGEQWRPLLHVKDVGEAMVYGLQKGLTGLYVLSRANHTLLALAELIRQVSGARIITSPLPTEDMRNYRVSAKKMRDTGWEPQYLLSQGIFEIINLVQSQRIKFVNDSIYSNGAYIKELYGKKA